MAGRAYNVGLDAANLSKDELALAVKEHVPELLRRTSPRSAAIPTSATTSSRTSACARPASRRGARSTTASRELLRAYRLLPRGAFRERVSGRAERSRASRSRSWRAGSARGSRPAIGERPKVLAEVRGRPFLALPARPGRGGGLPRRRALHRAGGPTQVEARARRAPRLRCALRYSREPEPLGTGGALRLRARRCSTGETRAGHERRQLLRRRPRGGLGVAPRARARQATLLLVEVADAARYGRVELDAAGAICRFVEKQAGADRAGSTPESTCWRARGSRASPRGRRSRWSATCSRAGSAAGLCGHRDPGRVSLISARPESYAAASAFFRAGGQGRRA